MSESEPVPVPPLTERQKRQLQWKKYPRMETAVPAIPLDMNEESEPLIDKATVMKKALNNPLVPLGMVATVGCLLGMFRATMNRNMHRAQFYMRGRCAAQFFTVCALVGGAVVVGWDPTKYSKKPEQEQTHKV